MPRLPSFPPLASNSYGSQATQVTISGTSPGRVLEERTLAFDWSENSVQQCRNGFTCMCVRSLAQCCISAFSFAPRSKQGIAFCGFLRKGLKSVSRTLSTLGHALASLGEAGEEEEEEEEEEEGRTPFRSSSCSMLPQYIHMNCPHGSTAMKIKTAGQQTRRPRNH